MASEFQKKSSSFFLTLFIGLIVISFMFTGYQSMRGTPDTVAKVNSESIKYAEYQMEFQRQLNFYKNLFGGQDLTQKQIENMNIRQATIRNLIQRKLMFLAGEELGTRPGSEAVKKSIKDLPYFKTNDQFDIQRYKAILRANSLTPTEFEKSQVEALTIDSTQKVLGEYPVSDAYVSDILKFKNQKIKADLVKINKGNLNKFIKVSSDEVKKYLSEDINKKRVESLFKDRKKSLSQEEQVRASHILLSTRGKDKKKVLQEIAKIRSKLTTKNFASLANKHTEDPSGKGKGGSLGWFGRGKMVKNFEDTAFKMKKGEISKPIETPFGYHVIYVQDKQKAKEATLAEHQNDLARELIQKSKSKEEKDLLEDIKRQVTSALKEGKSKTLERIQKRYSLNVDKGIEINMFDGTVGQIFLDDKQLTSIFSKGLDQNDIFTFDNASNVVIAKTSSIGESKENAPSLSEEKKSTKMVFSRKLSQSIVQKLEDSASIKVYSNTMR